MAILLATMPMYGIILYLLGSTVLKVCIGLDIPPFLQGMPLVVGPAAGAIAFFAQFNVIAMVLNPIFSLFFAADAPASKKKSK